MYPVACRRLLLLAYLLLSIVAQDPVSISSKADSTQRQSETAEHRIKDAGHGVSNVADEPPSKTSDEEGQGNSALSGRWGTGGAVGENIEDNPGSLRNVPIADVIEDVGDFPSGESPSTGNKAEEKNETGTKRHWGQMLKPAKETEVSPDSTSGKSARHIPFINKHQDGSSSGAFPEGFKLSARVFTGVDGLAYFDSDEDVSLPYVYCGADGSTTSALSVHSAIFREAIAAPTVWNAGDMRPTLAVALRSFRMKLDSGEEQGFQPGDVVLLEDTIRPGHQMVVSDHRDLVVMFVTLNRKHQDIGREKVSIRRATLRQRSCIDGGTKQTEKITNRLQSLEWDGRRLRTVILGIVSLSLSTLVADFLAKTAPLWLAVGIGGSVFVAGATYCLTVVMESVLTKFHLGSIRRSFDVRSKAESNHPQ